MFLDKNKKNGFVAIFSIIVICAVALAVAVSISLLGIGEADTSLSYAKGAETQKIAEGCLEEAMLRLRDKSTYSGGSLNIGNGSCTIAVSGTDPDRTIDITATIVGPPLYTKKLQITVKKAGNSINIVSWQEV